MASLVWAKDSDIHLRIRQTQDLLLLEGPSAVVLTEYDRLISDLENTEEKIANNVVAQVYYKKALVELSLNKIQPAVGDLIRTLDLDPSLTPASQKLLEVLMEGGRFSEIRSRFSADNHAVLFSKMENWEKLFLRVSSYVAGEVSDLDPSLCLEIVDLELKTVTLANPAVIEAHLACTKKKIVEVALSDAELVQALYKDLISDYSRLLKLQPLKSLHHYTELANYVLFTQNMAVDSWNIVKACLRIDNEYRECGALSKQFSRLQDVLKQLEEYSILIGYLYPNTKEQTDLPQDKLDLFEFDFAAIHQTLTSAVKLPKRDLDKLPLHVKTTYDFLLWKAEDFATQEFGLASFKTSFKFVSDLNMLACESAVRNKNVKNKYCLAVKDDDILFFPKYAAKVDSLTQRKKFNEAKTLLQKFNQNVQKTHFFKERVAPVERHFQQEQKQQQQKFNQQKQRQQYQRQRQQQQQQQQQRQPQHDPSKDYYKVLDIPRDADEKTIKKGYRTQTLKFHPDKYKGNDLTEKQIEAKMQEINEAYEVLSDPKLRESYDRGDTQEQPMGGHGQPNMNFQFNQDFMANFMRDGNFQFQFRQ